MQSTLPIIMLAAGANSRFFPLNESTHKAALTIQGKPLIVRTLEDLEKHGFEHVIIVVSPKDSNGKGLSAFLSAYEFKLQIEYVLQPEALGMGDAVLQALDKITDTFAVLYPYTLNAGEQLRKLISEAGRDGALEVAHTKEPWLYGILTLEGKRITGITEKPAKGTEKSNLKQHGMHYLSHEFLHLLEDTPASEYSFEAALDTFFQNHEVNAVEEIESFPTLKYPWHLFDFQKSLFADLTQYVSHQATIAKTAVLDSSKGSIYIEEGAKIGDFVKIVGPCYIGKNVLIGDYSFVRQSSIEAEAVIGANTEIVRSIVFENVSIHYGYVADSILGRGTKVGAGLIIGNKRLNRAHIQVKVKGQVVDTRRTNLGLITGEECNIGIRVSAMPGTMIGAHSEIWPTSLLYSVHPHQSVIKPKHT